MKSSPSRRGHPYRLSATRSRRSSGRVQGRPPSTRRTGAESKVMSGAGEGFEPRGLGGQLLRAARSGQFDLIISSQILAEVRDALTENFRLSAGPRSRISCGGWRTPPRWSSQSELNRSAAMVSSHSSQRLLSGRGLGEVEGAWLHGGRFTPCAHDRSTSVPRLLRSCASQSARCPGDAKPRCRPRIEGMRRRSSRGVRRYA